MAVAHDASSESHTGTTGAASVASFTWNHGGGASARFAVVFVFTIANAPIDTSVTYGGVTMTQIPYYAATNSGEKGSVRAYFLDNVATGTQAVVVNRTNNATVTYAVCMTGTAAGATEYYSGDIKTQSGPTSNTNASSTGATGTGTAGVKSIDDGSPGTNSKRYMGMHYGGSSILAAGTGSTGGLGIDYGLYVNATYHETTPGQGARNVGSASGTDDLALVAFAVREVPSFQITSSPIAFGWSPAATLSEDFIASAGPAFGWAPGGELSWPLPITIDSGGGAFGFAPGGTLSEDFLTSGGATFGWTPDASLSEDFIASAGPTFGWSPAATASEEFIASGGPVFGWTPDGLLDHAQSGFDLSGGPVFGWTPDATLSQDFITSGDAAFGWSPNATFSEDFIASGDATFGWAPNATLDMAVGSFDLSGGVAFGWQPSGYIETPVVPQDEGGAAPSRRGRTTPFDDWTITMDDESILEIYLLGKTR